ncbi:MAG: alpha/beta fold hydrolase [Beutenbergiaceae bacterium]
MLIHGFIVHGYTWCWLLPELSQHFRCYVVDLSGFGDSQWSAKTDFSITAQARCLTTLFDQLKLGSYSILAQDTGASIARIIAANQGHAVSSLACINTEIPSTGRRSFRRFRCWQSFPVPT